MKTVIIALLLIIPVLSFANTADLESRVLKLEQQVDQLQQQLDRLQHQVNSPAAPSTPVLSIPPTASGPEVPASQLLTLVTWSFRYVPIKFNTYYALDVDLHNSFTKKITEVEARIDFRDLLGELLYSITITPNLDLPAGQTMTDQGNHRNKRLLGRGHQLVGMEMKDLKAELIVNKLVFDDGTVLSF